MSHGRGQPSFSSTENGQTMKSWIAQKSSSLSLHGFHFLVDLLWYPHEDSQCGNYMRRIFNYLTTSTARGVAQTSSCSTEITKTTGPDLESPPKLSEIIYFVLVWCPHARFLLRPKSCTHFVLGYLFVIPDG